MRWKKCRAPSLILLLALIVGIPAGARDRIPLHVWGMTVTEGRFGWYAVIAEFERRHPHIEIVYGPADRGEDLQKLLCGIVGNSPPDLFRRESLLFGDIAARGVLMPLDEFLEEDKARPDGLHEEDFPPGAWQSGQYEGRMYAIPEGSNPLVLAYNRQYFREAGLDPDNPPRNWSEWVAATEKLMVRDAAGHVVRLGCNILVRDDLSFYIQQQGLDLFSPDGRRCRLDSPEGARAARFLKSMYEANGGRRAYDRFAATKIGSDQYDPLASGDVAMSVEDDWAIYRTMRTNPSMELGIAPVPAPDGFDPITISNTGLLYMIPANARHPREAWEFLRFVTSPEGQLLHFGTMQKYLRQKGEQHSYAGFRPNRRSQAALSERFAPKIHPFDRAYADAEAILELMIPPPISPVTGVLRDEARRAMDHVAYGSKTPEAALGEATARVNHQLELLYLRETLPPIRWAYVWLALALLVIGLAAYVVLRTRAHKARSRMQRYENRMGLFFISPWICGFVAFVAGPMVFSFAISFSDYDVIHPARYAGLSNYVALLTDDPLFWKSLANTAFMVLALPLGMTASLAIALLLNTQVRGVGVYRTLYYLPAVTPVVAAAVLWFALLNPNGIVNGFIVATLGEWFGVRPPAWLQDPRWSKPALVLMGLWGAGGGMILWLAGLQGIPRQLYETAALDGAGPIRRFFSITLPMLTPYIFFSFIVGVIGVFQIFSQALVLTAGGPADSTLFYVYYLFNNAFRYFKMGYASAMAWILFVIVLALTAIQWRLSKRWVHYE
jgi:ABC-type sugar transport system permease subunit/ABC-type glycerol-3-phosphate transport system substrate-binding protein